MPKIVDLEQQRAVILDLSFAVFVRRGYGHLRMRALAQDIGVSFGTLYHYFPSKEALFHALLERYFQRAFPPLLMLRSEGGDLRDTLLRITRQLEVSESEVSGLLILTLDYIQAQGVPFRALNGQTLDDLLETQITTSLNLGLPHAQLFRQQLIGVLMLRRLTPNGQTLSAALQPFTDLIAPP